MTEHQGANTHDQLVELLEQSSADFPPHPHSSLKWEDDINWVDLLAAKLAIFAMPDELRFITSETTEEETTIYAFTDDLVIRLIVAGKRYSGSQMRDVSASAWPRRTLLRIDVPSTSVLVPGRSEHDRWSRAKAELVYPDERVKFPGTMWDPKNTLAPVDEFLRSLADDISRR